MKKKEGEIVVREVPDWGVMPGVFNEGLIGKTEVASEKERRGMETVNDGLDVIREYGFSKSPVTGRSRIVNVMMKLEEKAMEGDIDAAKMFLDRTVGGVTQKVAIGHTKFQGMTDAELLKIAEKRILKGNK